MTKNWLDEAAEEIAAQNAAEFDKQDTPGARAKRAARIARDHEVGVKMGWWDENGEPLETAEEE